MYRDIGVGKEGGRDIQDVPGLDDEAPSGPDGARGHEGEVLSQRQLFRWTKEVGGAGEDNTPFHDWCPVFHPRDPWSASLSFLRKSNTGLPIVPFNQAMVLTRNAPF